VDVGAALKACSHETLRSTTHRTFVQTGTAGDAARRGMRGVTPRSRSSRPVLVEVVAAVGE
jgi:hypothetical protein